MSEKNKKKNVCLKGLLYYIVLHAYFCSIYIQCLDSMSNSKFLAGEKAINSQQFSPINYGSVGMGDSVQYRSLAINNARRYGRIHGGATLFCFH